jgi:hypothetical protein
MAPSKPADSTLLALAETLRALDTALLQANDAEPPLTDAEADELAARWTLTIEAIVPIRARTPRGRRAKAVALQLAAGRLSPAPQLFVDLSLSLAHDLALPLRGAR